MRKRVLLSLHFPREISLEGGGTLVREMAIALKEKGHDPAIHAPLSGSDGIECQVINSHQNGNRSFRSYAQQLRTLSREYDCVWIVLQSPATGAFNHGALPEGRGVVRLVASPYQSFDELWSGPHSIQYFKHWVGKNKALALSRPHAGTVVVSTEYQRNQMLRLGMLEENVHVIPFGISGNFDQLPSKTEAREEYGLPDGRIVSYLGHYSPIKGVSVLVKAFRAIADSIPDAHLALAWSGKGDDARKVHGLLSDPALEGRVHELGIVKPLHFLAASDVTVLPFVHSSFPHFPLVMIEAFAVGTPIVTSDIGGLREMVVDGETGLLVAPNDPDALAAALERLLGDRALLEHISANQLRSFRARYSASVAVDQLLQIS